MTSAEASDDQVTALESACEEAAGTEELETFLDQVFAEDDSYQGAANFDTFLEEQAELVGTQLSSYGIVD